MLVNKIHRLFKLIAIPLLLAACAPAVNMVTEIPTQTTPTATQHVCTPSKILTASSSFPEIQGSMQTGGELWALLFFNKAVVSKEEKIVWRITGSRGDFTVQAQNDEGTIISPVWGPEYHESSTWERPGEEWGTGFNFPKAGCWKLTASYGETIGQIGLDVVAS